MQPQLKTTHVNGVRLAYFERGARRDDLPTLLFVHATGFHGRVWDYHAEAFPEHHIIALEQRGHGRSDPVPVEHWRTFGEDLAAFVAELGLSDLIGIGHSMGAHAMIQGAAMAGAFASLILLDPVVAARADYAAPPVAWPEGAHPASKRRSTFASPEDMKARVGGKSAFPLFHPRIFDDYCVHGLERTESGEWTLLCRPAVEAAVYANARSNGAIYEAAASLDIPVLVVRAQTAEPGEEMNFSRSPTSPELVAAFPQGEELHWADCTHFIPMERPDAVVALIREAVLGWAH